VSSHILDLHGVRHHEVDLTVENFIYLNQEEMPLTIICGNSLKMITIVKEVLKRSNSDYKEGYGNEYGQIKVFKI
tara:strand:- start:795 stop:1019 length:225 start_codon:yes stop_codon:yes gene_type:complete